LSSEDKPHILVIVLVALQQQQQPLLSPLKVRHDLLRVLQPRVETRPRPNWRRLLLLGLER
jgi:hypothetical protein